MMGSNYKLRYLPLFEEDMENIVRYIAVKLKNPQAAKKLVDQVENSIKERLYNPISYEHYYSIKERENDYYRIYVKNYVIYYVVLNDIMEVRRMLYKGRNSLEEIY